MGTFLLGTVWHVSVHGRMEPRHLSGKQVAMRNDAHSNAELREGYEHAIRERNADLANLREDLQHALQVSGAAVDRSVLSLRGAKHRAEPCSILLSSGAPKCAGSLCHMGCVPSLPLPLRLQTHPNLAYPAQERESSDASLRELMRRNKQLTEEQAAASEALDVSHCTPCRCLRLAAAGAVLLDVAPRLHAVQRIRPGHDADTVRVPQAIQKTLAQSEQQNSALGGALQQGEGSPSWRGPACTPLTTGCSRASAGQQFWHMHALACQA